MDCRRQAADEVLPDLRGQGRAKECAEALVKELAKQSSAIMLTPSQASDALAAIERLNRFKESTGKQVSLLDAVCEFCATEKKLHGRSMWEVVERFDRAMGTVTRKDIGEAVEEFIAGEEPSTQSLDGERAQQSAKYHNNRAILLRRFAGAFPRNAACDLGKERIGSFFYSKKIAAFSTKSRRHHLAAVL